MRILAIQLKRLGDLVLTTGALRSLRQAYPAAQVCLLIDEYAEELAPAIEGVDETWVYRRKRILGLWPRLVGASFDVCLDFTGTDRSALATFLSKAPKRIGVRKRGQRPLRDWVYNASATSGVRDVHTVDLYLDVVRQLNGAAPPAEPSLRLPEAVITSAHGLVQELGVADAYFTVHAGAARPEKLWPPESWAEIIAEAHRFSGLPCLLTGGRDRAEVKQVRQIRAEIANRAPCFVLAGRTDLLLTCAVIRKTKFFLGIDSVGAHLAALFQRPALVLFGPTNPFHWRPRHAQARVVRAGFGPDYEPVSPVEKGRPMTQLSTETVIRAMEHLRGWI